MNKNACKFYLKKISFFIFFCLLSFLNANAQDTLQKVNLSKKNAISQQQKPYVILISIDGFRWDLADKYKAKNLIALRKAGVEAEYLKPSFPSLTFPNHYTIATGLYPVHHGIVDNNFYDKKREVIYRKSDKVMAVDSSWYAGKPIWVLAEEQQMLSAIYYWPGSEISMNGIRPTYFYNYNEIIPMGRRIETVKNWLQLPDHKRPHLIAFYFPQVDKAGHNYSVNSKATEAAVLEVDDAIGQLVQVAKATQLPINFMVVSDHGMTPIDQKNTIPLPKAINLSQFVVPPGTALLHLYAKNEAYIQSTYQALKADTTNYIVYLAKDIPKAWHYNKQSDIYNRVGDIILVPKLPKVFSINGLKSDVGQHGFDPSISDMHAIFYAQGPQFKSGIKIKAFENVHIYPLIAQILGLKINDKIDGKLEVLAPILNSPRLK
jgi:predicted AlkP superfamily pyrophosphatase or phosphodiesterase